MKIILLLLTLVLNATAHRPLIFKLINRPLQDPAPVNRYFQDQDGDGLGKPCIGKDTTVLPKVYVTKSKDCNDCESENKVHPIETDFLNPPPLPFFNDRQNIQIYPNPARHSLNIFGRGNKGQPVEIYDRLGILRLKTRMPAESEKLNLDLSQGSLDKGMYFVRIGSGATVLTSKFLIH